MMTYTPRPIDTAHIQLQDDLVQLTELLAANTHDIWAAQRIADGWTYGAQRDDAAKQHPDLLPYDELPEGEKTYDRLTAMETLKVMLALGYQVVKP